MYHHCASNSNLTDLLCCCIRRCPEIGRDVFARTVPTVGMTAAKRAAIIILHRGCCATSLAALAGRTLDRQEHNGNDGSAVDGWMRMTWMPGRQYAFPASCEAAATDEETRSFEDALARHRGRIDRYREAWQYRPDSNATNETKTPSRSWPDNVPSDDDLGWMRTDLIFCGRSRTEDDYCKRLVFRLACNMMIQFDDDSQLRGLKMLSDLAERGFADAQCYLGMKLNDGYARIPPDSIKAVEWFKKAADQDHPQGIYELAVAYYTGEGVEEDEELAVHLFRRAGEKNVPAAAYMLGDCLLDGVGVAMDRAQALEWLVRASELGHRGARSRVMAQLEVDDCDDYGEFTDRSRQSLKSALAKRKTTLRAKDG